jgi:hypothetical protein
MAGTGAAAAFGVAAPAAEPAARRCIVVDVFAAAAEDCRDVLRGVEEFADQRGGVVVVRRFPDVSDRDREDLAKLAARHGFDPAAGPVFAACGVAVAGAREPDAVVARLRSAATMTVFTRKGCGRCSRAEAWLVGLRDRYPGLGVEVLDLARDAAARDLLGQLVRQHNVAAASVPIFHFGGRLEVGFDRAETTGRRLEEILERWTCPCLARVDGSGDDAAPVTGSGIDLPLVGRVEPGTLGMPLFTLAVGLVDGFNPCAMWVLLLLLAVLVNLEDRLRMLAVAGTFVLVSGAAYFAFMAAWLNVFSWIGYLRPVQVVLGLVAVGIGLVHVKDFFAFRRGLSLSIPEAAKPGIYARVRRIVTAENLPAALAAAFALAVLVNVVELLCTAGLPALYTQVLAQQGFATPVRYGFLGLYIAAYMFDDAVMVGIAVATLSRMKLEETGGRWLKLVSGAVILCLGIVLLLRPDWLS